VIKCQMPGGSHLQLKDVVEEGAEKVGAKSHCPCGSLAHTFARGVSSGKLNRSPCREAHLPFARARGGPF
jgi:hypothetical protein